MSQPKQILTSQEADSVVQALRSTDVRDVERLDLHMRSGARVVFFTGGGTVAVYSPTNQVHASGPGVLRSDENYLSVDDLAVTYAIPVTVAAWDGYDNEQVPRT
jgi:hypothetical protein